MFSRIITPDRWHLAVFHRILSCIGETVFGYSMQKAVRIKSLKDSKYVGLIG